MGKKIINPTEENQVMAGELEMTMGKHLNSYGTISTNVAYWNFWYDGFHPIYKPQRYKNRLSSGAAESLRRKHRIPKNRNGVKLLPFEEKDKMPWDLCRYEYKGRVSPYVSGSKKDLDKVASYFEGDATSVVGSGRGATLFIGKQPSKIINYSRVQGHTFSNSICDNVRLSKNSDYLATVECVDSRLKNILAYSISSKQSDLKDMAVDELVVQNSNIEKLQAKRAKINCAYVALKNVRISQDKPMGWDKYMYFRDLILENCDIFCPGTFEFKLMGTRTGEIIANKKIFVFKAGDYYLTDELLEQEVIILPWEPEMS